MSALQFLSSLTTTTSLYGNSGAISETTFTLLRNVILYSTVASLLTPENHLLLSSAISWGIVTLVCLLNRRKKSKSSNPPSLWRESAVVAHAHDKKAKRKITVLVVCIILAGITESADNSGWTVRGSWWTKAGLPPTIQFLRTYVFGEPGILEASMRLSRRTILFVTTVAFLTLLPRFVSSTSYALGFSNIIFTSFSYVLIEDLTPNSSDREIAGTITDFDSIVANGLSTAAAFSTVGFIIAGIFYDSRELEYGTKDQKLIELSLLRVFFSGIVNAAKWLLIPLLVTRHTATSAGSVDLGSALAASLIYPRPSLTHILGVIIAIAGILASYFTAASDAIASLKVGPTRSLVGIFLIFILVSSLFLWTPSAPTNPAKKYTPPTNLGSTREHPMQYLIEDASNRYQQMQASQSKSLGDAVKNYKKRYNMYPPPHFDKWYEYAVQSSSVLIDEYDTIYHSLLPFWGLPPSMIRERAREALGKEQAFISLSIRGGKVSQVKGGQEWQQEATKGMIAKFIKFLPDMDLAFNTHDEPRIVVPHEQLAILVDRGLATNHAGSPHDKFSELPESEKASIPETNETRFNEFAHQPTWTNGILSCPADSPVRDIEQKAVDDVDKYAMQPLGFVKNKTAFTDICFQPSLQNRFGFFQRPNAYHVAHILFPVFSQSKVSSYNDILYPSPWYWAGKVKYEKEKDMPWNQKTDTLYWRGSTTGGFSRLRGWKKQHRQRVVTVINANDTCNVLESSGSGNSRLWTSKQVEKKDYHKLFDVFFSHVGQCDETDCAEQKEFFQMKPPADQQDAWMHKYLLDVDGNAFSGRFYAFLESHSAAFKMAIFREWHDEWLLPWVHYVPLSLQMDEVYEVMRYFIEEKSGMDDIIRIAEEGRKWANKVLRKEDFEVWFFRLLLE